MLQSDWIVKNWKFLSQRRIKRLRTYHIMRLVQDRNAPAQGKFYGTPQFLEENERFSCTTSTGGQRLLLRPFIVAPLPESEIKAIFIDPKKYEFDEEGNITGLKSLYEATIYIFED